MNKNNPVTKENKCVMFHKQREMQKSAIGHVWANPLQSVHEELSSCINLTVYKE